MQPPVIIILWILILSLPILALPVIGSQVLSCVDDMPTAASEMQELRSKLLLLESILDEKSNMLKCKHTQLEEKVQIVDEMELEIQSLEDAMSTLKNLQHGLEDERVDGLNQKVRRLWDESRKNNFEIHILEGQAQDSEKKLETLSSHVQKVKDIVIEQWIQIQQLEQALLLAKMRAAKERLKHKPHRLSFTQAIMNPFSSALFQENRPIFSGTYLPGAFYHLRRFLLYIQDYHFMLQHSLRRILESHGFTAFLAHDEIVFFMVSATIVFPLLTMLHFLVGLIR